MAPNTPLGTALVSSSSSAAAWAAVDAAGRFASGDVEVFTAMRLDPNRDAISVPAHRRVAWAAIGGGGLSCIRPGVGGAWDVSLHIGRTDAGSRSTFGAIDVDNLAAFARSADFGGTIKNLAAGFAASSGLTVPIVVLIDPSGAPTFAGGTTQDSRQLAAMERCRRACAPMAIWQAFEEERLIVDARWIETVRTDDRFVAIRDLLPNGMEPGLVYVTIPLRNDRAVVGVVAGFWPSSEPVTPDRVASWLSLADDLASSIRFSELLRRAQVNGAEAERVRIADDIHAGLGQSIFALSLEIARASAGDAAPSRDDLHAIRTMADELSADVRVFLSDGRTGNGGVNLARQLDELVDEIASQTGASVVVDHRVDWDEYGYDFADDILRIVAEAFRNVAKHATPTHIEFRSSMSVDSKDMTIVIADDGGSTAISPRSSAGVGLALISELVERRGGRTDFTTGSGGARLTIRVTPEYQSEWAVAQRMLTADARGT